jgi:hypothetical protein
MNHLIWRLHRTQVYFAGGALVALSILLIVTGTTMAHDYRAFLANCGATRTCSTGGGQLFSGDGAILDLVNFTIVVPLLFGLFWGAPLLAKEFEDGTHNLAWTQGTTRRHWLSTNVMWALLAAALWGATMTALVSWWRSPENALDTRFSTAFDIQGIAPVAYSLFAVALGIAVGSVFRRVLPAIATTLGIFVALRVAIGVYLRPHLMHPISQLAGLTGQRGAPKGSWILSSVLDGPGGHTYANVAKSDFPAVCESTLKGDGQLAHCLSSHGFRQLTTYQPANRFWAFQGIESAIFIVLAALLVGFAYWRTLARDA